MANIKIADSVIPAKANTPLDARSRVATEADILNIEAPAVGMLVYCLANGTFYVITGLKEKMIGAMVVPDLAVDTYKEFAADSSGDLSEAAEEELLNKLEDRLLNVKWGTE